MGLRHYGRVEQHSEPVSSLAEIVRDEHLFIAPRKCPGLSGPGMVLGAVAYFILWPLAVTAGIGAWQQLKMPERIFERIGKFLGLDAH
jgi:hypothetical protein